MVKSWYWVVRNILSYDHAVMIKEPSITKLQSSAWEINAPQKCGIYYGRWYLDT